MKKVISFVTTMLVVILATMPITTFAYEGSKEKTAVENAVESGYMTTIETENEEKATTEYSYYEVVTEDSGSKAQEAYATKEAEQEEIKKEIENNGGNYDYSIDFKGTSSSIMRNEDFDSKIEAEAFAEENAGEIIEKLEEPVEGESKSKNGFSSEEDARIWIKENSQQLVEKQISDKAEIVNAESKVFKDDIISDSYTAEIKTFLQNIIYNVEYFEEHASFFITVEGSGELSVTKEVLETDEAEEDETDESISKPVSDELSVENQIVNSVSNQETGSEPETENCVLETPITGDKNMVAPWCILVVSLLVLSITISKTNKKLKIKA